MIYMEKAFGAVCFFKSEVDVSQMLLLKASFQDHSLPFSTNSTKPDNGFSHRRIFVM